MSGLATDLSLCLVSWNVWADLRGCLLSLRQNPGVRLQIIVVDNASADDTVAHLRRDFPEVELIANAENRGFAAASNQALAAAEGRYLLLLNPDTVVPPHGLEELVAFADQRPEAGVVGPQLRYPDGRLQYSARHFPTVTAALFRNTPLSRLFPRARAVQAYLMADWEHNEVREVDWVSGAAMLIRREAYEQIGPLDERFYWGSEDVDYCWRAHQAGWKVLYTPTPRIVHAVGRSSDQAVRRTIVNTHRSMYRLYCKHLAHCPLSCALIWLGVWVRAGLLLLPLWLRRR
jgi:GT2 family glycosyltransferase